jgi:hypothetical protein
MTESKTNNLGSILAKSPNETIDVHLTSNHTHGDHRVFIVKNGVGYAFTITSILNAGARAVVHRILDDSVIDKEVIPYASKSLSFTKECNTAILSILQMYLARTQTNQIEQTEHSTQSTSKNQKNQKKVKKTTCSIKNGRRK